MDSVKKVQYLPIRTGWTTHTYALKDGILTTQEVEPPEGTDIRKVDPKAVKVCVFNAYPKNYQLFHRIYPDMMIITPDLLEASPRNLPRIRCQTLVFQGFDTIPGNLISGQSAIGRIIVEEGTKQLGSYCFRGLGNVKEIELPESLRTVGPAAFLECCSLKKLQIPNKVTSIGQEAFHLCVQLETLKLPASLEVLGAHALSRCMALKTLNLPKGIKYCAGDLYYPWELEDSRAEIKIPKTCTII